MTDWNAQQYLKFEDERTRPSRDLIAQIPLERPRGVVDVGCGPGNSTELLVQRWPQAAVTGMDSSDDMLRKARARLPAQTFISADIADWVPPEGTDVLFGNAVFQWVPDHLKQLQRLTAALGRGGVLAVQMPDNVEEPSHILMRDVAFEGPWRHKLAEATKLRDTLPKPDAYYDALQPLCQRVELWHTVYNHALEDAAAIVEWFKGSALQRYLVLLDPQEQQDFVKAYTARIAAAYLPRADGKVLLRFPRLFIVAVR